MREKGQNLVRGGLWMGGWLNRIVSKDILVKSAPERFPRVGKYTQLLLPNLNSFELLNPLTSHSEFKSWFDKNNFFRKVIRVNFLVSGHSCCCGRKGFCGRTHPLLTSRVSLASSSSECPSPASIIIIITPPLVLGIIDQHCSVSIWVQCTALNHWVALHYTELHQT